MNSRCRPTFLGFLGFLAFASVPATARADVIQASTTLPRAPVPWNRTATLPAFDTNLGVLRLVQFTVSGFVHGSWGLENTNAQPASVTDCIAAQITVQGAVGNFPAVNPAMEIYGVNLGAYDGTTDYAGTSGVTFVFGPEGGTGLPSYTLDIYQPQNMGPFLATAPGQSLVFVLDAIELGGACGPLPPGVVDQYSLLASTTLRIRYEFDPYPTWFCRPGAFLGGCPCSSLPSRGCPNSANASGGALDASGQASLSNDTLVLLGSGMPDTTALYIQGDGHDYGGFPYGDGRRCAAGTIRRLGTKSNVGGSSQYPGAGDASVSVRGLVPGPGATRYYQTIYRDTASFCTSSTLNVTDGVAIRWAP
jgi:hypothetical protein